MLLAAFLAGGLAGATGLDALTAEIDRLVLAGKPMRPALLLDVRRLGFGVRELVSRIEQALIDLLASYAVQASAKPDAPGVYVDGAKIASLGLRIRNGRSFHGLALNVDLDLAPFRRIYPCGYAGLAMTQLRDLAGPIELDEVRTRLRGQLVKHLDYAEQTTLTGGID